MREGIIGIKTCGTTRCWPLYVHRTEFRWDIGAAVSSAGCQMYVFYNDLHIEIGHKWGSCSSGCHLHIHIIRFVFISNCSLEGNIAAASAGIFFLLSHIWKCRICCARVYNFFILFLSFCVIITILFHRRRFHKMPKPLTEYFSFLLRFRFPSFI